MNQHIQRTPGDMIDVASLAKRSWLLFTSKPVEHLVASVITMVITTVSLGLLLGPLVVGHIRMIEKQERGEDIRIEDVFSGFSSFGAAFLTTLILMIGMGIGFLLLVLPMFFVMAAWGFALWFVALRDASSVEALGASWSLLKSNLGSVIVVLLLTAVLNAIGSSVLLAVLLTAPLSMIFSTLAFDQMLGADGSPLKSVDASPPMRV